MMFSTDALAQYRREIAESVRKADGPIAGENPQDLVEANLRFVIHIARRYQRSGVDLMDLIQDGNLGLLQAAHKFDPAQGVQFSTYAAYWIKWAILYGLPQAIRSGADAGSAG
jgi:RNA polymerase primary sigma factor